MKDHFCHAYLATEQRTFCLAALFVSTILFLLSRTRHVVVYSKCNQALPNIDVPPQVYWYWYIFVITLPIIYSKFKGLYMCISNCALLDKRNVNKLCVCD